MTPSKQKKYYVLFISVFVLLLGVPLAENIQFAWHSKSLSSMLNTFKSKEYLISKSQTLQFLDSARSWVRYNGFHLAPNRNFFRSHADWFISRQGKLKLSKGKTIGFRGLADHLGLAPLSSEQVDHWISVLEQRHQFLAERGIRYLVGFVPRKSTIYPEKIYPQEILRALKPTRLDQLRKQLNAHPFINFIDLTNSLKSVKQTIPADSYLYFKTDAHWNIRGAYWGYHAIATALSKKFSYTHLTPVHWSQFKLRYIRNWCHKGFASKAGVCVREDYPFLELKADNPLQWLSPQSSLHVHKSYPAYTTPQRKTEPVTASPTALSKGALLRKGLGRARLPYITLPDAEGNARKYAYIKNHRPTPIGRILVLSASFGQRLVYFMSAHAAETYWYREVRGFDPFIRHHDASVLTPDIVIQLFAEGVAKAKKLPSMHNLPRRNNAN